MAGKSLVCALKETNFYVLFSTSHWQDCRYDGSAPAATLDHEQETAGWRWKSYKIERVQVPDAIKPPSKLGQLLFRCCDTEKLTVFLSRRPLLFEPFFQH